MNVLGAGMAGDALGPGGVYFGTKGGRVCGCAAGGYSWARTGRDLPAVRSVEVQTLR